MTPVFLLTDGYIANGAEPWKIPALSALKPITVSHPTQPNGNGEEYLPYLRNERLTRSWAIPGTPGLEHRLGGLEKQNRTGNVSYDPENHQAMTEIRRRKVQNIAETIPLQEVDGPDSGDLLVVSWGGTFGAVRTACSQARKQGKSVSHCHLRYINPFPKNLGALLKQFKRVLVPELNAGQLWLILRGLFLVDAISFSKVKGKPFLVSELTRKIDEVLQS
jgi:2-oxoglutarate ferredoxin oxidoreductase subunit alpha